MKYFFLKRYNPAYDFFVTRYLKEGGIETEGLTPERARYKLSLLNDRKEEPLTPHQKVFAVYARTWASLPDVRPTTYNVFWHMFNKEPSLAQIMEFEPQLPPGQGRLLFSMEETANDLSNFYKMFMTDPLRKDLENGAKGRAISRYFVTKELDRWLKLRGQPAKLEEENQRIAKELLAWFEEITITSMLKDLERILAEHYDSPFHMRPGKFPSPYQNRKMEKCDHDSEYLKLSVVHDSADDQPIAILRPIRGLGLIEEGWEEFYFPWYRVLVETNSRLDIADNLVPD